MSSVLAHYAETTELDNRDPQVQLMIDNICCMNNTLSQADSVVRSEMSNPEILERVRSIMFTQAEGIRHKLSSSNILELCKSIKNVGMDSEARENLTLAGALTMACEMLKVEICEDPVELLHIRFHLLDFLDEMCKLDKARTRIVATSNLLPLLREFIISASHLQLHPAATRVVMGLFILTGYDQDVMHNLIKDHLIELYSDLLPRPYWGAMSLSAIAPLFSDRAFNIEPIMLREESLELIRQGFFKVSESHTLSFVQSLAGMCERSVQLVNGLVNMAFAKVIIQRFGMPLKSTSQIPAALLNLLKVIVKSGAPNVRILRGMKPLTEVVQRFVHSSNLRERTFTNEILPLIS
jgi:hypothetical protein